MFQRLAWHYQFILGLWTSPKCDLDEVEKTMIQLVEFHFEVFSASWPTENVAFFKSIMRLFKCSNGTKKSFFASWQAQNSTLVRSRKRCFKWSSGTRNSFSSSWPAQNAKWVKSRKRCFKGSIVLLTHFRLLDQPIMRFGWGRKRVGLWSRMALSTYFGLVE